MEMLILIQNMLAQQHLEQCLTEHLGVVAGQGTCSWQSQAWLGTPVIVGVFVWEAGGHRLRALVYSPGEPMKTEEHPRATMKQQLALEEAWELPQALLVFLENSWGPELQLMMSGMETGNCAAQDLPSFLPCTWA